MSITKRFLLAGFLCIVGLFLGVAIFDYSPTQCHYITTDFHPDDNLAGTFGATTAFWSFRFFGLSTILLPFIPFFFAISAFMPIKFPFWHGLFALNFILLMILICGWFQIFGHFDVDFQRLNAGMGGIIGGISIEKLLRPVLGKFGSILLLFFLLFAQITIHVAIILKRPLVQKALNLIKTLSLIFWKALTLQPLRNLYKRLETLPTEKSSKEKEQTAPLEIPEQESNLIDLQTPAPPLNGVQIFEEKMIDKTNVPLKKRDTNYIFPTIDLLERSSKNNVNQENCSAVAHRLVDILAQFGITVTPGEIHKGPVITRYEVTPDIGIRVEKIVNLDKNIAMGLAAKSVRIIAPVPGKNCVGIELPNKNPSSVHLREILESQSWANMKAAIPIVLGRGVTGEPMIYDLAKMPHLLIAGATGSGKTVCINTIVASLLYHASPENLRFIMVDPKIVEMQNYNRLPHMLVPVVTDPKKVPSALKWLIAEMEFRYQIFAKVGVRNIANYNENLARLPKTNDDGTENKKLPYIVCIIDELADLMMVAPGDIETYIARLAQLARAAGIHLILATQRPSVNVITGIIKANLPCRIAFKVSSKVDSRTILDTGGAESLLGQGDMLFSPPGAFGLIRAQGALVSDEEINSIVEFLYKKNGGPKFEENVQNQIENGADGDDNSDEWDDEMIPKALEIIRANDHASTSFLQRKLKIGYNRAARIMDTLREQGLVSSDPEN